MSARIVNIFKKLLILTFSVVFSIAAAEVVIRWFDLPVPPKNKNLAPQNYYKADKYLGYDINPNTAKVKHHLDELSYDISSNRFGCFDYERMVPPKYILALGDSFTWGFTPLDKKWTTLLEKRLDKFIMKCGVSGFGVKQSLRKGQSVISEIGANPTAVIYMYYTNDLNDDVLMPHKTVYSGYLVSLIKSLDLETGEIEHRTKEEIESRFRKFKEGSWSNGMREFRYSLATYRLFQAGKDILERKIRATMEQWFSAHVNIPVLASATVVLPTMSALEGVASSGSNLGSGDLDKFQLIGEAKAREQTVPSGLPRIITNMYRIMLMDYVDTIDRPWFTKAVGKHKNKILEMASYVRSLGAKFILIDVNGDLEHKQFNNIREHFEASPNQFYFNLKKTYDNQQTWNNDIHWNLRGNADVADYVYEFLRKNQIFLD